MKLKLVELVWVDIQTEAGWHDSTNDGLLTLKSYGLLVQKTKNAYVLASGWDAEYERWSDLMKFPAGCVKSMRLIEIVDFPSKK